MTKASGFSLIEVIVTVSMLAILAGTVIPTAGKSLGRYNLTTSRDALVALVSQARERAITNTNVSPKGIAVVNNTFVGFSGNSYATRNTSLDIVYPVASSVAITGTPEITFAQLTALSNGGSITLTSDGLSYTISVNQEGILDW